jgi:Protein of unknown function (DUF1214)
VTAGDELRVRWERFCEDLKVLGTDLGRPTTPDDDVTVAEGIRHLTRLVRMGLETSVESLGPSHPVLMQLVDETKKFGCDNPDTIYLGAALDGTGTFRIKGARGSVDYLSFTTSAGARGAVRRTGFLDSSTLEVGHDGTLDITVSATPSSGNWLAVEPDSNALGVRQTFLDRDAEEPAQLRIERLDAVAAPDPLTRESLDARLDGAVAFARYVARTFTEWTEGYQRHPNELPSADQEKCLAAGGDPNIHFYRSYWEVGPNEALVVHIPRIPTCDTWNLQVDNYWQESMDRRFHRSHINKHTAVLDADGGVTAVIAHRDPGVPNWLDTAGHRLGHFAMRWVRAVEHVDPETRLCRFEDLR